MHFSPKTVNDGLVFHYDTGNTVRSYKGEPTTNVVPNQSLTWQQYNTSITQNAITAPDGTLTGIKITATATTQVRTEFNLANPASATYYAFSIYAKRGSTPYAGLYTYFTPYASPYVVFNLDTGTLASSASTTSTYIEYIKDGWYRIGMVVPVATDQTYRLMKVIQTSTTDPNGGVSGNYVYYWKPQVENKSHITPHTTSTRSATQGLLDLTGRSTANLANVSFDADAQIRFDGTDDYIEVPDATYLRLTTDMSFEFVVYADSTQSNLYPRLIDKSNFLVHLSQTAPFSIAQNVNTSSGLRQVAVGSGFEANTWTHIITTYDGQVGKVYVNSKLVATNDWGSVLGATTSSTSVRIGGDGFTSRPLSGLLPVVKVYNRALTADEVKRNFTAIRSRFNI